MAASKSTLSGPFPNPIDSPTRRYRLAYIRTKGGPPAVLYDNHHPKGHHKHIGIHQFPYYYISMEKLIEDFQKDVQKAHENL